MEQVSLPVRLALVAVLAMAALWFVALRPGGDAAPEAAPAPAPVAAPAAEAPAAAAAAKPVRPAAKQPAAEKNDLGAPLVRHLGRGRAVVVLFAGRGADDRAVRRAVRAADRRDGRVLVRVAPIGEVADYKAITTGVQVVQAPTTLVIGPDRKARAITGLTDVAEVDQAVGDALAAAR